MHKIRHNCVNEFVKLCLRYTARDPRLRTIDAQTKYQNNNKHGAKEIVVVGGQAKFIFKYFGCMPTTVDHHLIQYHHQLQRLVALLLLFFLTPIPLVITNINRNRSSSTDTNNDQSIWINQFKIVNCNTINTIELKTKVPEF